MAVADRWLQLCTAKSCDFHRICLIYHCDFLSCFHQTIAAKTAVFRTGESRRMDHTFESLVCCALFGDVSGRPAHRFHAAAV